MSVKQETGYLNNPLLKKPNKQLNWTSENLEEYLKCESDPIYFAEKYIKIIQVDKGLIPIVLYDYQKETIIKFQNSRNLACSIARQMGKTTVAVCIILHYTIFNKHKLVGLLANKLEIAREILQRIKTAYEYLPDFLQQGITVWNKTSIEFENGCKIVASASTADSIRGKSVSLLYIDENSRVSGWNEFAASVLPTLSSGDETKLLFSSTPNGINHWYYICEGAKNGTNGFAFVEAKWDRIPGRGEEWKQNMLKTLNWDTAKWEVEFELEFAGSSGTLISGSTLKSLKPMEPINTSETLDSLTQYFKPVKDRKYTIMVDSGEGLGLDYSAFQVIDITEMPYQQVCTYKNNLIEVKDYAGIIHNISKLYNNASILVELNNIGATVSHILYNEYENECMIMTEDAGRAGQRISSGFGKRVNKGIKTSTTTKRIGCSILKMLIEQKQLVIVDQATIEELSRFSRDGDSYEAEEGSNDDLVMGLVLFGWMSNQKYFKELTDINTMENLRKKTDEQIVTSLLGFIAIDSFLHNSEESALPIDYNNPEIFYSISNYSTL